MRIIEHKTLGNLIIPAEGYNLYYWDDAPDISRLLKFYGINVRENVILQQFS